MRLLKRSLSGSLELVQFDDDSPPPYTILSHTWVDGQEVTYQELLTSSRQDKSGYSKIRFCMDKAVADGYEYCWVDTCCIDKSNAQELQAAINLMFQYYQRAKKCYVHLADVEVLEDVDDLHAFRVTWENAFRRSRWFTRSWTLQELLAPATVEFFSANEKQLGSKISLEREIHEITGLPKEVLREGQPRFSAFSFEEKLSWAAQRTTTIKEDKVYCLLGIFGVLIPLMYGEGEVYATERLNDEITRRRQGRGTENVQDLTVPSMLPSPRNKQFRGGKGEQALQQHLDVFAHLFECKSCDRTFGSDQALQQHRNSPAHAFECQSCDRTFGNDQALQQHRDSPAHVFECKSCDRTFASDQALRQHRNSPAHAFECQSCNRTFVSDQALQQHRTSSAHAFECQSCDRTFGSKQALKQHLSSPTHGLGRSSQTR